MMLRVNRAVSISFKGLLSDVNRCSALRSRLHRLFILLHKGKNRLQLLGVPRLVRPLAEGLSRHVMNFTFEVHAEVTQWREGREIREQTVLRCDAGGCGGVVKNVTHSSSNTQDSKTKERPKSVAVRGEAYSLRAFPTHDITSKTPVGRCSSCRGHSVSHEHLKSSPHSLVQTQDLLPLLWI